MGSVEVLAIWVRWEPEKKEGIWAREKYDERNLKYLYKSIG
jgi:hypothetical protein